jgi:hypothetical protein
MIWIGKIRITPREVTMKYTPLSFEVNLRPEGDIEAELLSKINPKIRWLNFTVLA